jgi:Rhamnan synthesis protein F
MTMLRLTELSDVHHEGGLLRYATSGTWRRTLFHTFIAVREVMTAVPRDVARSLRKRSVPWLRMESGIHPNPGAARIALYVHYSATGRISEMVRYQVSLLGNFGFSIVFISMSDQIPEADWEAVRQLAALVVQRPNFGLDFGAWRDVMPEIRRRWPVPLELLLANDSVLGPIHPLAPAIEAMRAGGDGLFGLTESLQGGPHLQSYMLLARGAPAVEDMMRFVQNLHVSSSKWILVRMGEVRLSRWMRRRGHRVAALFGYERLTRATIADPEERKRLQATYRRLQNLEQLSTEAAIAALHRWPLNPTHHLWRVLATQFDFPFLKTELIRRNPVHLPGVAEWRTLVPPDSPCPPEVIEAHLATLEAPNVEHVRVQRATLP